MFLVIKCSATATQMRITDEKMQVASTRTALIEFRLTWTSTRSAHRAVNSADGIALICIICSMIVVHLSLYCTQKQNKRRFTMNVLHNLKFDTCFTANIIRAKCIQFAINLPFLWFQKQYSARILQNSDQYSTVQIYFNLYCIILSSTKVTPGPDLRQMECLVHFTDL